MNKEPAGKCNADSEELAGRLACMTRQNAAKLVHEWLRDICHEPDETDIVTFQNQKTRDMLYRALSYVRTDDAFQQDAPSEK